jgi:hypothetical protein
MKARPQTQGKTDPDAGLTAYRIGLRESLGEMGSARCNRIAGVYDFQPDPARFPKHLMQTQDASGVIMPRKGEVSQYPRIVDDRRKTHT